MGPIGVNTMPSWDEAIGASAPILGAINPLFGGIAAGVSALGGLFGKKKQQSAAEKQQAALMQQQQQAMAKQQELISMATPAYQSLINMSQAPAYNYGDMEDPYSPAMNLLRSGQYQDDTGLQVERAKAAARANVPRGTVGGSNVGANLGAIDRQALTDNASFARSLRIQGGEERYRNRKAAEDAQIQRLQMLSSPILGAQSNLASNIGGMQSLAQKNAEYYGGEYNKSLGTFGQAAKDIFTAIKTKRDGTGVGQNTTGTNNVGKPPFQGALTPEQITAIQKKSGYGGG